MKWFIALMLILNAAIFLWEKAEFSIAENLPVASARPDIRPDTMRLLSETQAKAVTSKSTDFKSVIITEDCIRIGPFVSQEAFVKSKKKIDVLKIVYHPSTEKTREIQAYRVYVGPLGDKLAIAAEIQKLNSAGIEDHYIIREKNGESLLSLGLFSQQNSATKFIASLEGKKLSPKQRKELRSIGERYWLEVDPSHQQGAALEKLFQLSWSEKRVQIKNAQCSAIK